MALINSIQNFLLFIRLLFQYVTIINLVNSYEISKFDHECSEKTDDPDIGIAILYLCSDRSLF